MLIPAAARRSSMRPWGIGGQPRVVEDRHVGRVRFEAVPPLLPHPADVVPAESAAGGLGMLAAEGPDHEVVVRGRS